MPREASSLSQLLRERVARHARAGRTALIETHGAVSYAELGERIERYSSVLPALAGDVARGELVGVPASRSAESVARFFGVMQAGACPAFLEPGLGAEALARCAQTVDMPRVVLDEESAGLTQDLEQAGLRVHSAGELQPQSRRSAAAAAASHGTLGGADLAMMQFTSGTASGRPKGALLSHGNLLAHARGIIERTGLTELDRLLHVMPLNHTNGVNNQLIAPLLAGATIVLAPRFCPEDVEDQIAEHRVTYVTGVPTMYARVLPHLRGGAALRSLRFLRCGSAPITAQLHEEVEAAFETPLIVSYGLSEATCTSAMNPIGARRVGTVGTVLRGQRVGIFLPGTGQRAPTGAEGEIRIAGPCLMRGYAGRPAGSGAEYEEAESPIRGGWLRTGDLGCFDGDGYLAVTGRLKEVIVRGGETVSPRSIEDVLAGHPAVTACCVVGRPDADLGEAVVAFVVRRGGAAVDAAALSALVGRHLPRSHVPAAIRFIEALPVTAVGKVDRRALRARA
ncbi:MAG: acyl--CoA ligase [Acidobacteria bacterium]|nr:acyl--CoA ligase [Acidobacteriota bacterium]